MVDLPNEVFCVFTAAQSHRRVPIGFPFEYESIFGSLCKLACRGVVLNNAAITLSAAGANFYHLCLGSYTNMLLSLFEIAKLAAYSS